VRKKCSDWAVETSTGIYGLPLRCKDVFAGGCRGSDCVNISGFIMRPSTRALMTIRSQEPHKSIGVTATVSGIRFFLRRSDLFPSTTTFLQSRRGSTSSIQPRVTGRGPTSGLHHFRLPGLITCAVGENCPSNARVFGSQRNGSDIDVPALL
jgi:hypothetical protein